MALEDKIDKLIIALEADTAARKEQTALLIESRREFLERTGGEAADPAAPKRGRGRPAKGETVQQNETEDKGGDAATETVEETKAAEPAAPTYTIEQVKTAGFALKEKQGVAAAKAMVAKHGADILVNLKPEVFGAFIADCEKAIAAAAEEDL